MATKKTPVATAPSVKLVAVEPIRHDGDDYAPGDELEADGVSAKQLVDIGAAQLAPGAEFPQIDPAA